MINGILLGKVTGRKFEGGGFNSWRSWIWVQYFVWQI